MTGHPAKMGSRKCNRGHDRTPENLNNKGKCRECVRINSRTARRRASLLQKLREQEARDIAVGKIEYLYLTPEQQDASDTLTEAVRKSGKAGTLLCQKTTTVFDKTRDRFVDVYPHTDYDERTPPTAVAAARMCAGCPVIQECLDYAKAIRPAGGVFGGTTFIDGEAQTH